VLLVLALLDLQLEDGVIDSVENLVAATLLVEQGLHGLKPPGKLVVKELKFFDHFSILKLILKARFNQIIHHRAHFCFECEVVNFLVPDFSFWSWFEFALASDDFVDGVLLVKLWFFYHELFT